MACSDEALVGRLQRVTRLLWRSCWSWGLTDRRGRRLGGFSGGERQRVGIAQALFNDLVTTEERARLSERCLCSNVSRADGITRLRYIAEERPTERAAPVRQTPLPMDGFCAKIEGTMLRPAHSAAGQNITYQIRNHSWETILYDRLI